MLKRRILVYGTGHRAAFIAHWLRRNTDRRSFAIVGYVHVPGGDIIVPAEKHVRIEGSLVRWALREHIDEIVRSVRTTAAATCRWTNCSSASITASKWRNLVQFLERESGKVELTAYPSWLVFLRRFRRVRNSAASPSAHSTVFGAALVLAVTWPLMLLVTAAIRLESGAGQPILYRQDRVGERGRVFSLIKFRSMRTDAELDGVARWASKNDDRVTRVGRLHPQSSTG